MPEILLSNSTGQGRRLSYRMPNEKIKVRYFKIAPYAINFKVSFPDEASLSEFRRQLAYLFNGKNPVLVEGKQVTKRKLEEANKNIEKERQENIDSELKQGEAEIADAAEKSGSKIQVTVTKKDKGKK